MKKLLSIMVAIAMLFTMSAAALADEGAATAEKGVVIYGSTTELSGDWGRALWTNNASDKTIRDLTEDYSTVVSDQGGEYLINETIVADYQTTMNEDESKTFTVKINEGLTYNNGDPITAKDYVAEALFLCSSIAKDMSIATSLPEKIVGGEAYLDGTAKAVSGLRLLDEYTFSMTIDSEYVPYYYDITYAGASPMSLPFWFGGDIDIADDGEGCYFTGNYTTAAVEPVMTAARFESSNRVSAGPYNLVSFDKGSLQATLTINPNYVGNFEGQKPSIEKIVVVKAEDATWTDAIKTGAFNFYDTLTDGDDINTALDIIEEGGFEYVQFDRPGYGKIQFQCDFGPTQFLAVRHAVAKLLDRNEFANTFCMGWGGVVDGPYGTAMWMAQDSEELFAEKLNAYTYSYDDAVAMLVEDGWTFNAEGGEYTEGIRYKKVTAEEAGTYLHNVTLADGTVLMPLIIEWSSSEGNPVSELLKVMLAENPDVAKAGMKINQTVMTFAELLNFMYRDATQGDKYGVPTYGMYNLATNYTPTYDASYNWTSDPDKVAQGFNVNYMFDDTLDQLSMDMVYGVDSSDSEKFLDLWQQYIIRWNELLPEVPLYSNIYITMFPDWLENYTQDAYWDFAQAIVYATVAE